MFTFMPACASKTSDNPRHASPGGRDRVALDVARNPLELSFVAYPTIVGFSLPELLPNPSQKLVRLPGRKPFDRLLQLAGRHLRRQQEMHMVGHHHPRVQAIVPRFALAKLERIGDKLRDLAPAMPGRAVAGSVQESVYGGKRFSTVQSLRPNLAVVRQRAVEPPGQEKRRSPGLPVRKAPAIEVHPGKWLRTRQPLPQMWGKRPRLQAGFQAGLSAGIRLRGLRDQGMIAADVCDHDIRVQQNTTSRAH